MSTPPSMARLGSSMVAGAGWSALGQFGAKAINFVAGLALVLFLDPRDFGLVDSAWAIILVLDSFVDFGMGMAIIQRKELSARILNTAFTINLLLALLASATIVGCGFAVDSGNLLELESDSHDTAVVLWQLSAASIFTGLTTIPRALLLRELRLAAVAKLTLAGSTARGGVSVIFASLGYGAQSLVFGAYAGAMVSAVMAYAFTRVRLRPGWHAGWRELTHFGVRLTSFNLINNVLMFSDRFILVPILGQESFGIYSLARRLMLQTAELAGSILRVFFFPMMARLQDSRARLRAIYLRTDQVLVACMLPFFVLLAGTLDLLAESLLDAKWGPVAPTALALLPAGLALLLLQTPGSLLLARGLSGRLVRWGLIRGTVMVAAYLSSLWLPLPGVALTLGLFLFLATPLLLKGSMEILDLRLRAFFGSLVSVTVAGAAMAAVLVGMRFLLLGLGCGPRLTLVLAALTSAGTYLLVIAAQKVQAWRYLSRALRQYRLRGGGVAEPLPEPVE